MAADQEGWKDDRVPSTFTIITESAAEPSALFDASLDIDLHVASMADSCSSPTSGA